ncbi:MAG: ATP-binding protein, partial [Pyrinomonadaceae bacterium]
ANQKLAEILGYASPDELMREAENLNTRFYVEPGRRREFRRLIEENESVAGFESEIYRRDGSTIWITENALGYYDKSGKLIGYQGTTIEITDRKRAEAALERARAELEGKVIERTAELNRANEILRGEISERRRIEDELLTSQKQLQDLSAHLQFVREEERKKIARELHDELGQSLTALKIDLVRLGEKNRGTEKSLSALEIKNRIATMLEIVDAAMDMTRKIVAELRPGVLDELGLAAAMEWQVGEFQKRAKIVCGLEIEFDESDDCQNLKTTIFRILQECLTNIARHSGASRAQIKLQDEGSRIIFQVEDNGRGFDEQALSNPHSFGILGMRERARLLGGTVEISRVESGGTRVSVSIPHGARQAN